MREMLDLVELAVWSAALAGEDNPVSVLLVAPPESGKSELIRAYSGSRYTQTFTDFTAYGLVKEVLPRATTAPVLLVPDLIGPLSRQRHVAQGVLAALLAYTEEGISRIATKFLQVDLPSPARGSVVTAVTTGELEERLYSWRRNGFLSRFLVLSYSYPGNARQMIVESIRQRGRDNHDRPLVVLPNRVHVELPPGDLLKVTDRLWAPYARSLGIEGYGFRWAKMLRRLCCARALRAGRDILAREDVEAVMALVERYAGLERREAR